jgi:hypothetical protein
MGIIKSTDSAGPDEYLLTDASGNLMIKSAANNGVDIGDVDIKSLPELAVASRIMLTGNKVTTTTAADQVILTYTVTAGKTFYLTYLRIDTRLTTFATTATNFGYTSLESPAGTKLLTQMQAGAGITVMPPYAFLKTVPIAAGTVIRVVCTPSSTTSYTWQANFGGYEL